MARPVEVTDEELIEQVRRIDAAATSEIADAVGLSRQGADKRLRELRDAGRVRSKKIGASLVWLPGDSPAKPDTGGRRGDDDPTTAVNFLDAVNDAVTHMAGGDELPDTRTPALREAVSQLRRDGEATVDDLVSGAYQREAGGYTSSDSYRRSVTSALDALANRRPEIATDGDRYVWHGGGDE
jgi:DNA-binding Lrp family transcriptional regulator